MFLCPAPHPASPHAQPPGFGFLHSAGVSLAMGSRDAFLAFSLSISVLHLDQDPSLQVSVGSTGTLPRTLPLGTMHPSLPLPLAEGQDSAASTLPCLLNLPPLVGTIRCIFHLCPSPDPTWLQGIFLNGKSGCGPASSRRPSS